MSSTLSRRAFLHAAAAAPLAGSQVLRRPDGLPAGQAPLQSIRIGRAVRSSMLPAEGTWKERLQAAAAAGFDGLEMIAVESPTEADEVARAAAETKLTIHSVVCPATLEFPLSSADPAVVTKSVFALKNALASAATWRAEEVLITPAVVDAPPSANEAWTRSQSVLREQILPLAGAFRIHIGLAVPTEGFLLSALECNRFIDGLRSPWAKASLGIGDTVPHGPAQEWIRTLGRRLTRLRLSDRRRDSSGTDHRNLGDGDVEWQDVRRAMNEAPFLAWVTADLDRGDGPYLTNVRVRVDKFLAGFKPGGAAGH